MGRYKSNFDDNDIKNLKQIVALYDQLAKAQKDGARYMEIYDKISNRISNLNIKNLSTVQSSESVIRETYNQLVEIERLEQNRSKAQEKTNELVRKYNNMWNIINDEQFEMKQRLYDLDEKRLKLAKASNLEDEEKERRLKEIKQEYEDINKILNKEKAQKDAKKNFKESTIGAVFGTSSQDIKDIENGTYLLNTAAKVFSKAVETFKTAVKEGINKNYDATEHIYNSIVASNSRGVGLSWSGGSFKFGGNTYSGYKQINNAVRDQLSEDGLYNNISNVDVMNATSVLTASGGLGLESAIAKAYQDTVIKYIVPYLDTSSDTFTTLEYLMPGISKNVAATALDVKEQLGENQYVAKYSNQLVELMQPVSLQANKALYSEQYSKIAMEAEKYVAAGVMSPATAQKMVNEAFQAYMDPTGTLSNGSTLGKMTVTGAIATGDVDNPAAYVSGMFNNTTKMMSWGGGNSLNENAIMNNVGGVSFREINLDKLGNISNATTSGYEEQLKIYREQVGLADTMNTTTNKIETATTNMMADISEIKTFLSEKVWGVGEVIVNGITAFLGAKFLDLLSGGKLGNWISGIFTSGSKTAGSAAKASATATKASGVLGSMAAVGGGIALGVGAANVIKGAIEGAFRKEDGHNTEAEGNNLKGTALEGNRAAQVLGGMATTDQRENNNFGSILGSSWNTVTRWMGVGTLGWTRDTAQINKDDLSFFREKLRSLGGGPTKDAASDALLVWTLLLASAGRLSDIEEFSGMTNESLKQMVEVSGVSPSSWEKYLETDVKRIGYLPNKNEKEDQTTIDWAKLGIPYHRLGLSEVPYDNYVASLHEGEAVLTASTANELRNLITEYRDTTNQAVSFDAIIQAQTATLVTKFDEVVSAIKSTGGGVTTVTAQTKAISKLNDSMTYMRNTKNV